VGVLENGGRPLALFVDELVGQVQVVVKNLELGFAANAFMGATILGNGRVAMILDVQALSRAAASSTAHSDRVARPVEPNKEAA
jgi:two-component system chemotaxis sensor kinase CheA